MTSDNNHNDTLAEQTLDAVAKDPKNVNFLVRCIGISLIITSILASLSVGILAGQAAKSYLLNKIEKCN